MIQKGYIQIYTGDGKGKTTAAIGLALRAIGAGLRVYLAQFMKGAESSEIKALMTLNQALGGGKIDIRRNWDKSFILAEPKPYQMQMAKDLFDDVLKALMSARYDVVILDEVIVAHTLGLINHEEIMALFLNKPQRTELLLTGRGASSELMEKADLVTEMREIKHYYRFGVAAREGIEY